VRQERISKVPSPKGQPLGEGSPKKGGKEKQRTDAPEKKKRKGKSGRKRMQDQ